MATIDFPSSPTMGQEYPFGDFIYVWDGVKWTTKVIVGSTEESDARYVNVTGDTMTGTLNITNSQPITIKSDASAMIQQRTLNNQRRWYIGESNTSFDLALYSDTHASGLVVRSDHIDFLSDPRTTDVQGVTPSSLTRKDYVDGFLPLSGRVAGSGVAAGVRLNLTKDLGHSADAKECLIVLCEKYVDTTLPKNGFTGRIHFSRGGTSSSLINDVIDLAVESAYNNTGAIIYFKHGSSLASGSKIVEITYEGKPHWALYRGVGSMAHVSAIGIGYGDKFPVLIPDATGISMIDVTSSQVLYHDGNPPPALMERTVTREEYDTLLARIEALEAQVNLTSVM